MSWWQLVCWSGIVAMDLRHLVSIRRIRLSVRLLRNLCLGVCLAMFALSLSTALPAQTGAAKPKPAAKKSAAAAKKPVRSAKRKPTSAKKPVAAAKRPTTASKKPAARKPVRSAKKAAPSKSKVTRTAAKRTPVRRTTRRQPARAARPRVPQQPGPERLTEIQSALAKAGYLQGEPTGKWDDGSIAAMKRFQQEHAIPATGKINALSLIALGLGPVRGPAPGVESVLTPPAPDTPAPTSPTADR